MYQIRSDLAVPTCRRAEAKGNGLEQAKFKETLAERQETLEEKKYKKMVEENVRCCPYSAHFADTT